MERFQFRVLIVLCLLLAFFMGCTREESIESSQDIIAAQEEAIESNQDNFVTNEVYSHSFSNWVEISAPRWGIEGTEERVCNYCGERQVQTIPQYTYGLEINQDGVVVSRGSVTEDVIIIPSTISPTNNTPVTAIGDNAFINTRFGRYGHSEGITRIRIPNSVITIGERAFLDNRLATVIIPNSVTSIGALAFSGNHELTGVVIPDSVTSIGGSAFSSCSITDITIPDNLTVIERQVFLSNRLTSVTIPDSVTIIERMAFADNPLTSLTIGNNVTTIETSAFRNNRLTGVVIPDSVITIEAGAFWGTPLTNLTIGNGVTSIGTVAFRTGYLSSIVIPNSVTTIWVNSFDGTLPISITIPANVDIMDSHIEPTERDAAFRAFYNNNDRRAGVYSFDGNVWSFSP